MESRRIASGSSIIDQLLEGGYETDIITTLYGPGGVGKTNVCMLASIEVARSGKKVVYIDTEGGFSVNRLLQLAPNYKEFINNIVFLQPSSFKEQKESFEKLKDLVNDRIGIIIVDTIAMLYRLEIGKTDEVYETNRALGLQISYLTEIARKKGIPVLIANQVYSVFDNRNQVNMVGGDILKYWSKCLIELKRTPDGKRKAILKKHRSLAEEKEIHFQIKEKGLEKIRPQ